MYFKYFQFHSDIKTPTAIER